MINIMFELYVKIMLKQKIVFQTGQFTDMRIVRVLDKHHCKCVISLQVLILLIGSFKYLNWRD